MSLFKYNDSNGDKLDKNDLKNKGHFNFPVWRSSANVHGMYVGHLFASSSYIKRLSRQRVDWIGAEDSANLDKSGKKSQ